MLRTPRYLSFFLWCLYACGHVADPKQVQDDTMSGQHPDTLFHPPAKDTLPPSSPESGDSIMVLASSGNRDTLHADIQKEYQQIHIRIPVTGTQHLAVQLKPEGYERNVRISQIEMPDGKTDGPFGLTMQYKTGKKGTYTLIIARSNMADGTVKGPVNIFVQKN
ncbi:hypothetical protein LL912_12005 [Niabella sp. CC-SYL272]|uniref:hypothetical protein n=1 Tax=Niabella agricola TaxID=2891571 RepID=UPI001F396F57|nr:hypothetical protein [Niabella agricola]MCF3109496.1 hypothetical protein [Niabella agricola]